MKDSDWLLAIGSAAIGATIATQYDMLQLFFSPYSPEVSSLLWLKALAGAVALAMGIVIFFFFYWYVGKIQKGKKKENVKAGNPEQEVVKRIKYYTSEGKPVYEEQPRITAEERKDKNQQTVRNQHILIVIAVAALSISLAAMIISFTLMSFTTRPSYLIMELETATSGSIFDDIAHEYRVGGRPGGAPHLARINLWNTGQQVAENVTVGVRIEPPNSNITLWDMRTMTKCRDIVCNTSPTGQANEVTIRAIEAGGFYSVVADYTIYLENLNKVEGPVIFWVEVKNSTTGQEIHVPYTIKFGS